MTPPQTPGFGVAAIYQLTKCPKPLSPMTPTRGPIVTLCLVAMAACTPVVPPGGATPRVLGACCPETDAGIYALMEKYEATPAAQRPPELAVLPYRMNSGLSEREQIVVRDRESWTALWPRIVGSHRPVPPVPPVDFSDEMLIVASMGTRPSGGYTIYVDDVSVDRGSLLARIREQGPGAGCGVTGALTAPVALVRLERSAVPVRFVSRSVVRNC